MRDERKAHQPVREREQQLEVATRRSIGLRDFEPVVASCDLNLVRRRVRLAESRRAVDLHPEAARCSLAIAIAEVAKPPGIAGAVEQLRVFEGDLARLTGRDREDASADQALPGELDQRRVALLAYDGLINGARLRGIHRLPAQLLIALPQRIAREHGLARQGEVVHPFVHYGAVIDEGMYHF